MTTTHKIFGSDRNGRSEVDLEAVKARVREVAWDTGQECPTCHGDGKVPGGRRVIHSIWGGIGADWDLQAVLDEIDRAQRVEWREGHPRGRHLLAVYSRTPPILFEVTPAEATP